MKIKKILALMAAGTMLMTMGGCNAITIDGEENPYMNIVGNNVQEVQKYVVENQPCGGTSLPSL